VTVITFAGTKIVSTCQKKTDSICRKRPMPHLWKCNVHHEARVQGEEYVNTKSDVVDAKIFGLMENCNCHFQCHEHFSADAQAQLFSDYLRLSDILHQKAFLAQQIVEKSFVVCHCP